jgi:outer membrane protein, heavy metal efflux system
MFLSSRPAVLALVALLLASCASAPEIHGQALSRVSEQVAAGTGHSVVELRAAGAEIDARLRDPLDEEAAVRIALARNPRIAAELEELGVAAADLAQAARPSNPVLALDALAFGSGTELVLGVRQSFLDLLLLSARRRTARDELAAAEARIARYVTGVAFDVRRAIAELRAARRLAEIEREALKAARSARDLTAELHEAGNVTAPELAARELELERTRFASERADLAAREAREPLAVLLGLSDASLSWDVEADSAEIAAHDTDEAAESTETIEERAVAASLDLAESRGSAAAQARRIGLDPWGARFAESTLGVASARDHEGGRSGTGATLDVSIPVLDRGDAREHAARSALRASLARHAALEAEVRSAARVLGRRSALLAREARDRRERELPVAARYVLERLRDYNAMQIGAFEVLDARRRELASERDAIRSARDARLARLDLDELLAGRLDRERLSARFDALADEERAPSAAH